MTQVVPTEAPTQRQLFGVGKGFGSSPRVQSPTRAFTGDSNTFRQPSPVASQAATVASFVVGSSPAKARRSTKATGPQQIAGLAADKGAPSHDGHGAPFLFGGGSCAKLQRNLFSGEGSSMPTSAAPAAPAPPGPPPLFKFQTDPSQSPDASANGVNGSSKAARTPGRARGTSRRAASGGSKSPKQAAANGWTAPVDSRVPVAGLTARFTDSVNVTDSAAHLPERFAATAGMHGSNQDTEASAASASLAARLAEATLRQSADSSQPGSTAAEVQQHHDQPTPSMETEQQDAPWSAKSQQQQEPAPATDQQRSRSERSPHAAHGSFLFTASPSGGVRKHTFTAGAASTTPRTASSARRPGRRGAGTDKAAASPSAAAPVTPSFTPTAGTPMNWSPMECSPFPSISAGHSPASAAATSGPAAAATSPRAPFGVAQQQPQQPQQPSYRAASPATARDSAPARPSTPSAATESLPRPSTSSSNGHTYVARGQVDAVAAGNVAQQAPDTPPAKPTASSASSGLVPGSTEAPAFVFGAADPATPKAPSFAHAAQGSHQPPPFSFTAKPSQPSDNAAPATKSASGGPFRAGISVPPRRGRTAKGPSARGAGRSATATGARGFSLHIGTDSAPGAAARGTAARESVPKPRTAAQHQWREVPPATSGVRPAPAISGVGASGTATQTPAFTFKGAAQPPLWKQAAEQQPEPRPALSPQAAQPTPQKRMPGQAAAAHAAMASPTAAPEFTAAAAPPARGRHRRRLMRPRDSVAAAAGKGVLAWGNVATVSQEASVQFSGLSPATSTAAGYADTRSASAGASQPSAPEMGVSAAELSVSAAEMCMQRGNQAFNTSKYDAAERAYTQAIEHVWHIPTASGMLAKLLSNRAAARLMLGQPQASLADCHASLQANAGYTRAAVRGATCHLRLGDFAAAAEMLRSSMSVAGPASSVEVSEKLEEVDRLQRSFQQARQEILEAPAQEAVDSALRDLDALLPSLAAAPAAFLLRAHALLRLGRQKEALAADTWQTGNHAVLTGTPSWLWWTRIQAAALSGNLTKVEALLKGGWPDSGVQGANQPLPLELPDTAALQELLADVAAVAALKEQGNSCIKSGDHAMAVKRYSEALSAKRPLLPGVAAVLHANRAAAHQAQGQLAEAIADCARARALDPSYAKAHSRMAALLMEVGRPKAAVEALEAVQQLGGVAASEQAALSSRLRAAQAAARQPPRPDHYKLLGLQRTATVDDVRKAYKKFALRMHPDKALMSCRFQERLLPGALLVADAVAIQERVRNEANKLFSLIGEAHAELSDPVRRRELDAEHAYAAAAGSRPARGGYSHQPYGGSAYTRSKASYAQQRGGFYGSGYARGKSYGYGGYSSGYAGHYSGFDSDEDDPVWGYY